MDAMFDQVRSVLCAFREEAAADDIYMSEDVAFSGEVSGDEYAAAVLLRKVYSILMLSAARSGLIPAIEESTIPLLYDSHEEKYKDVIFPGRRDLTDWVIYDDRVIESFVMPVIKQYGWKEVMLLREREEADSLDDVPLEVKQWVRDEIGDIYEDVYGDEYEIGSDGDVPQYFIPEGSCFAAVVYENEIFSRLLHLGMSLERRGYRLDELLVDEDLALYQRIAGYHFEPVTSLTFSFERKWVDEHCYHCVLARDTVVSNDYGCEYLDGYSFYKYADPGLIYLLPEMDAGMKKLLPVVEALIEKAEAGELHAMRSVA